MMSRVRESTKVGGYFALSISSILMMLITILLMIEDRCGISFAMYIYNALYVMKTGAKQTGSFTLILMAWCRTRRMLLVVE